MRTAATVLAVGMLLALTGCDSGSAGPGPETTDVSTPAGPTASDSPSTPPSPTPIGRPTHCTDATGDGEGADLTQVDVDETADAVRVTWTTTQDVASIAAGRLNALFGLQLTSTGGDALLLGVKESDGAFLVPIAYSTTLPAVAVDTPASASGSTLTAIYPAGTLAPLGPAWTFQASVSLRGNNVDDCPG